jgi:hypothetical protein
MGDDLRFLQLEKRIDALEKERSGRKGKPILVSEAGICGLEPAIDSATCPFASLYRRNQGCQGDACKAKASKYYSDRRAKAG